MRNRLGAFVACAVVVFAVAGIGRALVGGNVFHGAELLLQYAPYRDAAPEGFRAETPCVSDTVDNVMPASTEFRRRALDGEFAQWDSYAGGGAPLASVPNFATLSPYSIPALVLPPWLSPAYVKLLEILGGAFGCFLFLRAVGASRAAGWLAGIVFASSGFMVTWTNWPQTRTAACIPWLFWAVERFVQKRSVLPLALSVAALLLGGFPSVAGYALYALVPYLVVRLVVERRDRIDPARRTVFGLLAIGAGGALVAFQLLPFAAQLSELELERRQSPSVHLPFGSIVTAFAPSVYGDCGAKGWVGPYNQVEVIAFVGAVALVLAGVALLRGPASDLRRGVRGFFAVAALVTLVLGWYGGLPLRIAQQFPVFSNNPVFRVRSVFGFFVAVLAAIGFDRLQREPAPTTPRRWRLEAGAWAIAVIGTAVLVHRVDSGLADSDIYSRRAFLLPAVAGLVAVVVALAVATRRIAADERIRSVLLGALVVLVLVESVTFVRSYWPHTDRDAFYPETSVHEYLAARDGNGERYAATGFTMFPGTNVYYGLSTPNGHGFTQKPWMELLKTVDPTVQRTPTFTAFASGLAIERVNSPILDRLAVRWLVTDPREPVYGSVEAPPAADSTVALGRAPIDVPIGTAGLRAVIVTPERVAVGAAWIRAEVRDGSTVVATNRRRLEGTGAIQIALPAEHAATAQRTLRLRLEGAGPVLLAATGNVPAVGAVRPVDDGLHLAFAAGANVWDRIGPMDRVRWASEVVVRRDAQQRLTWLANVRHPAAVVLEHDVPPVSGAGAVVHADADHHTIEVDAQGSGYVVVADSLSNGWVATVDGKDARIETADHAMAAVRVERGRHTVVLEYRPTHQRLGIVIAVLTALALAALQLRRKIAQR